MPISYGFIGLEHMFSQRVEDVGIPVIRDAIALTVAEYNRQIASLTSKLVTPTENWQERFKLPGFGTHQPLDEWGNPQPTKPSGFYDVAYPIFGAGSAYGDNRVSRALATVEEVNDLTWMVLLNDIDWMRRRILSALFSNVAWTYEDSEHGNLTIQPLANGDTVTYVRVGGTSSTDTHYLAQAAAIADVTNPFPTIYAELVEHPSNTGPIVVFVPTNQVTAIQGLSSFTEVVDPDIIVGVGNNRLGGVPAEIKAFGDEVLGKTDKCWIVEWKQLPDNYMIALDFGAPSIMRMREYKAASLKGLFPEFHSPDGNLIVSRFLRYAGFGVQNRVGALVYRIGDAAYAVPTGFTAPLAI